MAVRTPKINPIITAITSISTTNDGIPNSSRCDQPEKSSQLYLTFPSSNFFLGHLEVINTQMIDFERECPQVWQNGQVSYLNQGSGRTETALFRYTSNHTLLLPESSILSQDLFRGGFGVMSGGTGLFE